MALPQKLECDAVSEDGTIVCFISTSSSKTDTGVIAKIRDNAFWAGSLSEKPQKIVFAFTDKSMVELIKIEKKDGRFPKHIKTLLVKLPAK